MRFLVTRVDTLLSLATMRLLWLSRKTTSKRFARLFAKRRKDLPRRDDLTTLATKGDIASVKEELVAVEGRLKRKIEAEAENLARITVREFGRVHRRTEALAHHVGYTFEPEADEHP
jgi:hypothetical protein